VPAVAADYVPVAGFSDLSPDEFSLPVLKLVQPQTKNDDAEKHPGEYLNATAGEYLNNPNVLVVGIAKTRVMFPKEYSADSKPLCRSDNGNEPRAEFIGTYVGNVIIPEECAVCPFGQWQEGSKDAPPCSLVDNWAVILGNGDPAILRLSGSSAKTSALLKNIMRGNRLAGRATHIRLGSVFTRTQKGQYYVATVTPCRDAISPDALATAKMLAGVNLAARAAVEQDEPAANRTVSHDDDPDEWPDGSVAARPF
jgi:hypothetical protein